MDTDVTRQSAGARTTDWAYVSRHGRSNPPVDFCLNHLGDRLHRCPPHRCIIDASRRPQPIECSAEGEVLNRVLLRTRKLLAVEQRHQRIDSFVEAEPG